jgi:hypothetical protein
MGGWIGLESLLAKPGAVEFSGLRWLSGKGFSGTSRKIGLEMVWTIATLEKWKGGLFPSDRCPDQREFKSYADAYYSTQA